MKACQITFSVYFLVLITCLLALDSTGLTALALFCAAIHEMGHLLVLFIFRIHIKEIAFHLFGVDIHADEKDRLSYEQEVLLALAGIIANLLLCMVMAIFWRTGIWIGPAQAVFSMSLVLAMFNVLPVGSLDGGRALEALICAHATPQTAERILYICSVLVLLPVGSYGFGLLIHAHNVTLLAAAVYLMISLVWHGSNIKNVQRRAAK